MIHCISFHALNVFFKPNCWVYQVLSAFLRFHELSGHLCDSAFCVKLSRNRVNSIKQLPLYIFHYLNIWVLFQKWNLFKTLKSEDGKVFSAGLLPIRKAPVMVRLATTLVASPHRHWTGKESAGCADQFSHLRHGSKGWKCILIPSTRRRQQLRKP